jgi:GDP-4-dehydro-6-deoxy-D-mannose reductase
MNGRPASLSLDQTAGEHDIAASMKAFITGMSGFVGGYLAEHLLALGDEVLGSSRSAQWPSWAGDDLRRRAPLVAWDIGQPEPPLEARRQIAAFMPDCIYHLAALSVPGDCGTIEPTDRALSVNVGGTRRVVELAASLARPPRVLFVSTSHVYGRADRDHHRFDEQTPTNPHRAYGKTKLLAEREVRRAIAEQRLDAVIARSFQHTGPRQEPRLMLPEWAAQFAQPGDGPVRVKHLDTWIDLTDVRDVVRAYRLLIERGERGGIYNVGSGMSRRTGDILLVLARLAGSTREVVELAPGDECWDPIADIGRLQAATDWRPEVALERTVAETLADWQGSERMKDEG